MSPYRDPEERRRYQREFMREWRKSHTEPGKAEYDRRYRQTHSSELADYQRRWYQANKAKVAAVNRLRLYGITPERFAEMWVEQDGQCANPGCDAPLTESAHIDHDHRHCPGRSGCATCVRGLLCAGCNVGLGAFQDDPARLRGMADYLEAHPPKERNQLELDL